VCDERVYLLRVTGRKVEAYECAAAGTEHECRFSTNSRQQPVRIICEELDNSPVIDRFVEAAPRNSSWVIGHERELVGEMRGNALERVGIRRPAGDHQQYRT